jgi:FHA domain-containing protein
VSTARNLRNLAPIALVEDATQLDLRSFLARYGDAMFLLVRIPEGDTELELGLRTLNTGASPSAVAKPMPFRTTHQATPSESRRAAEPRREDPAALGRRIDKEAYFAAPIQKRGDSDATFMARISVGRAPNKDIVLRHASISKFHAWFEMSAEATLCVCDAGSTNLTHVNGRPVEPRATVAVDAGDEIRFGAVETVLSSPEGLWTCLNADKRGESVASLGRH